MGFGSTTNSPVGRHKRHIYLVKGLIGEESCENASLYSAPSSWIWSAFENAWHTTSIFTECQYDDGFLTWLRQPDEVFRFLAVWLNDSSQARVQIKSYSWNAFFSTGVAAVPAHSSSKRRAPQPKAEEERELPTRRASLMWTYRSLLKSRGQQTTLFLLPGLAYCCHTK